jgi:predicted Fe-S protein YdhL (DUF1289 family)
MDWTEQKAVPSAERHSPCVGVCRIDEKTGICIGCARSQDEIAQWRSLDDDARKLIWDALPGRAASLSIGVRLMPLTADEILAWVANSISKRRGTWVTGMLGAVAEFVGADDQEVSVQAEAGEVVAQTGTASFRLRHHEKLRAFAFGQDGPIVLGLPKVRLTLPTTQAFTALGADRDAIAPSNRDHVLFDYGLGPKSSRFCIRTGKPDLISLLEPHHGRPWQTVMAAAGGQVLAESPTRVVESVLARIEVFAPIPLPGGSSPAGAHTHFLPQFLASGEDTPARLALPDYAAPIAIFYPA